jgi:biopolymer transport protein ExbD
MNSGRIAIGLLIILAFAIMLMVKTTTLPNAYAASNSNQSTTASVTVNGFVSITLTGGTITFGNLDPGVNDSRATNAPLLVRVDNATNVPVMGYINGSVFTDGGSNSFVVGNMKLNITGNSTAINASCNTARCSYTLTPSWVFNETAPLGTGHKGEYFWNYISVPEGQAPTTYNANVRICGQQTGAMQCN